MLFYVLEYGQGQQNLNKSRILRNQDSKGLQDDSTMYKCTVYHYQINHNRCV
jgi:hypothetical protein